MTDNIVAASVGGLVTGIFLIALFGFIYSQQHDRSYTLVLGNTTFEIKYRFTEGGRINNLTMSFPTLSITAKVDVPRDGFLEIHFPKEMLKELEIGSGYHYCVGNEFAIFVDKDLFQPSYRENNEDVILTFPVKGGSQTIAFAGTDLLMTNPTCPT